MKNKYPLVSVIITTIGADYIEKAIKSVQSQTYSNIELIVCYDGENFNLFKKRLEEKFDNVILLNVGPFNNANNARNIGVKKALGEYIALLDDDDYWDKHHIEYNVSIIRKINNNILLISNSVLIEKDKEVKILPERYFDDEKESVAEYLFVKKNRKRTIMQTSAFFFNKEIIDLCSFDKNLSLHQDYDWVIHLDEIPSVKIQQTRLNTSFYVMDANINSISKKSKSTESINWAEKKLKNYPEKIGYSFFRNNTLWFLRNDSLFYKLSVINYAVKKLKLNRLHFYYLVLLGAYSYLKYKVRD